MHGKVAVITGAAFGIGAATATLFAREGASIVAADVASTRMIVSLAAARTGAVVRRESR